VIFAGLVRGATTLGITTLNIIKIYDVHLTLTKFNEISRFQVIVNDNFTPFCLIPYFCTYTLTLFKILQQRAFESLSNLGIF
jgi:hypothetical protein